jgi:hypothetical protein
MTHDILHMLAAESAIRAELHNYCRAMDRRDDKLGYAVWHEDGTADYGPDVFQGSGRDFVDHVSQFHLRHAAHSHQIATVGITVAADRAVSEAYATVRLRTATADRFIEHLYVGRYLDRWSHRGGRWAIDHRLWILDFDEDDHPVRSSRPTESRRDRADRSYVVLASIET